MESSIWKPCGDIYKQHKPARAREPVMNSSVIQAAFTLKQNRFIELKKKRSLILDSLSEVRPLQDLIVWKIGRCRYKGSKSLSVADADLIRRNQVIRRHSQTPEERIICCSTRTTGYSPKWSTETLGTCGEEINIATYNI